MEVTVATVCMDSGTDVTKNIKYASDSVISAASQGADWILLPETFSHMGPRANHIKSAFHDEDPRIIEFKMLSKKLGVTIFLGTVPERVKDSDKIFNTLYVIDKSGEIIAKYRKTHLFSLNGLKPEDSYQEKNTYIAGDQLKTLKIDGFQVHLSICYDIRFSAMFNKLQAKSQCDVIVCPSAFAMSTGKRHWHILMQSRAIEYQCYVVAAAQTGLKSDSRSNYGHALICDPMGKIIEDTGSTPGIIISKLSKSHLKKTRQTLPVLKDLRHDLY